jgi:hypothetical protein
MKHMKLYEEFVNEFSLFRKLTDDEIVKYLEAHPARRKMWNEIKGDPEKKEAMIEFFKENPHYVKNDEIPMNIHWDEAEKEFKHADRTSVVSPYA